MGLAVLAALGIALWGLSLVTIVAAVGGLSWAGTYRSLRRAAGPP